MIIKKLLTVIFVVFILLCGNFSAQTKYQKDFNEFWNDINDHYAYLNEQKIDWKKAKEIYEPQAEKINNDSDFIRLLENVLNELYNGHSSLSINLNSSNRLIPSGQDVYIEKRGNEYFVTDIRKGFGADQSGLKIGMQVTKFNGKDIDSQLQKFLPKFTQNHSAKMYQYALDMLFAGTHDTKREITVIENKKEKVFKPIDYNYGPSETLLSSKVLNENTVYIRVNNSLGNNNLISEFDKTLDTFINFKNVIIDLTETPSGGNSTVARAIMGRFTDKQLPYQIHEFDEKQFETKRHWTEFVAPRKTIFKGNVYILVGHWTGSMGEGIAIGFDGMKKAKIIGTPMAGLLGAISEFKLSETQIRYQFPTERLYHITGTPREDFIPQVRTQNIEETILKAKEIK